MPINRDWLDGRMAELGLTKYSLQHTHGVSYATFDKWDEGTVRPRPDTLRRVALALQVTYLELVRRLRVSPGDFSEDGRRLTAIRLKKSRRRVKA